MNVPGPKILLIGDSGAGKTYSLRTLIASGLKVAAVFTEPGMETVADIPCSAGLHWRYVPPATAGWDELRESAKSINTLSNDALQKLPGVSKSKYSQWFDLLNAMANFTCERCGQNFGPVDKLDESWAVFNDSLSGICTLSNNLTVGGKPVRTQPDWGIMMDNVERYVKQFTTGIRTLAVLTAHLERQPDEITGGVTLMAMSLGNKLSPKLPKDFSEVILAKRDGTKFTWSTAAGNVALKARMLPVQEGLPPDFAPIIKAWRANAQKPTQPKGE